MQEQLSDMRAQRLPGWPALVFCTGVLVTVAANAVLFLHGPLQPGQATGAVSAAAWSTPVTGADEALPVLHRRHAATSTGSDPGESEWEQQRAEQLRVQRLNAEMAPDTGGLTQEQYVQREFESPQDDGDVDDSERGPDAVPQAPRPVRGAHVLQASQEDD